MTEKDILFKDITNDMKNSCRDFCYFGWEGVGPFALWRYAQAYYESAEYLFDKFKSSSGNNAVLDNTGITMCFLYRHFVELSIKHLFVNLVCQTKEEYKTFLQRKHNLKKLWRDTKPKLEELIKRVGSSVDMVVLEHYIMEFHSFDKDSMAMRYPMTMDLKPMKKQIRLDIYNLHDRMEELYWAFEGLNCDLENQLQKDVAQDKIDAFLFKYEELKGRIRWFIETMQHYIEKETVKIDVEDLMKSILNSEEEENSMMVYNSCTDDELILFDTLYYTGRAISSGELKLPKNPNEAKIDAVKMCIINMERDQLEFGKPKNDKINIYCKMASSVVEFVSKTVSVIDEEL